ncbi:aldose epimerase family protein [Robertkochia solimangrovi]|uniref:aldose epimerase family protein n=1 Tax=Robertkochia solimangrovi TaxID=2213046 RepID=UPI0013A52ED9|nr:aldose epimerase family protein [Robertkochia solimangrovi]
MGCKFYLQTAIVLYALLLVGCSEPQLSIASMGTADEQEVSVYKVDFPNGLKAEVLNYGGILKSLSIPDKHGVYKDIVLGFDDLQGYLNNSPYFGAVVGRFANRIRQGKFQLNNTYYDLDLNDGDNHLHGGFEGFDKKVWEISKVEDKRDTVRIQFKLLSPNGDQGYPGNLLTFIQYTFTKDQLRISYKATTDQTTIVNLTQHSYFNLSGNPETTILDHELEINAAYYIPIDEDLIPLGNFRNVKNSPFDFTSTKSIGEEINSEDEQIKIAGGYDHCFVIDTLEHGTLKKIAVVSHPESGRQMEIYTTEPGVQFYSGNFLDGRLLGKAGINYKRRSGFCLETQHFPDSPNHPKFPTVELYPDEAYESETIFKFGITENLNRL